MVCVRTAGFHARYSPSEVSEKLAAFITKHNVRRLNAAGSRESKEPGIYEWAAGVLERLLKD